MSDYDLIFCLLWIVVFPEKEGVQFWEPQVSDVSPPSQQRPAHGGHLRCPVYVYHVSLDHLKDQLVHPTSSRQSRDVFMRYRQKEGNSTWRRSYLFIIQCLT